MSIFYNSQAVRDNYFRKWQEFIYEDIFTILDYFNKVPGKRLSECKKALKSLSEFLPECYQPEESVLWGFYCDSHGVVRNKNLAGYARVRAEHLETISILEADNRADICATDPVPAHAALKKGGGL